MYPYAIIARGWAAFSQRRSQMPHMFGRGEEFASPNTCISGERKRAEDEQARVHNLLAVSQRIAHIGSWEYERSTQKISLSDEMYRIAGIPVGSPITLALAVSSCPPTSSGVREMAIDASIRAEVHTSSITKYNALTVN